MARAASMQRCKLATISASFRRWPADGPPQARTDVNYAARLSTATDGVGLCGAASGKAAGAESVVAMTYGSQ